jgi:hypothetical protein
VTQYRNAQEAFAAAIKAYKKGWSTKEAAALHYAQRCFDTPEAYQSAAREAYKAAGCIPPC